VTTPIIHDPGAAQLALLCGDAEAMFPASTPQILDPPLAMRAMPAWDLIGHFVAADALLGAQALGLGQTVYYGFLAQSRVIPSNYAAVIRGTEDAAEWAINLEGFLVPRVPVGMVEQGFYSIYRSMRYFKSGFTVSGMLAAQAIANLIPDGGLLTICGHSLGAAIAIYLTTDTARIPNRQFSLAGAFFASPKPGDGKFAADVNSVVGADHYRVYNATDDLVPHQPPLFFEDLPQTTYITPLTSQAIIARNPICAHRATSYAARLDYSTVTAPTDCILGPNPALVLPS
jgi:triacylglycerol lipase